MRKLLLLITCTCFILSGCWDSVELNDIAIVTGMSIDPGKEKLYRLTVGYVNPGPLSRQSQEQGAPVSIMTLEGDSLPEISARMNIGVSRKLVFSHTRAIYISEKVAREGVSTFLDSVERSPQFRNDFNILITKNNEARDFAMINDPIEKVPSVKVQKQIQNFTEGWGGDPRIRLTDFINAMVSKGRSPVASTVIIQGNAEKGKNADSNMSIEPAANIVLDGMAVFNKDKLIGFLSLEDTRNYVWTQKLKSTMVTLPCEEGEGKDKFMDIVITNNKSVMKTEYKGDRPQLKVDIYAEARLNSMHCPEDLTKISSYEKLEEKSEEFIANMIEETIKKVQTEYGVDIFGFGETLNRQDHKKAKKVREKWEEEFVRGDADVNVQLALRRVGTRNNSFLSELPDEDGEN